MIKDIYQIALISIVFCIGFSLQSVVSKFENEGDVNDIYIHKQLEPLQCTINIDCDNSYDWSVLFPKEELPEKYLLEYPGEMDHRHLRR